MKTKLYILLPLLALSLIGCDRHGDATATDPAVIQENGVATVHITANDLMRYNITRFTVHTGEKVRITLQNVGIMPLATMGHDLTILKKGQNYQQFATDVTAAGGLVDGELPQSLLGRVLAHTKLLGPGEKQTIEFTAPAPGEYQYLCTFPTHFVFMNGVMIVQ